jgi:hypothetical protein
MPEKSINGDLRYWKKAEIKKILNQYKKIKQRKHPPRGAVKELLKEYGITSSHIRYWLGKVKR